MIRSTIPVRFDWWIRALSQYGQQIIEIPLMQQVQLSDDGCPIAVLICTAGITADTLLVQNDSQ
jgi:hypothetical protein